MNILLVYPKYPDSFWSFTHALRFISKKAAVPPLGLITVSAMFPPTWQKKLIDLNVQTLFDKDILWADYVFISAMYIQKESVSQIIEKCVKLQVKMVAGGPLFTQEPKNYPQISHFILNEAEITFPAFIKDFEAGKPKKLYKTDKYADMAQSPVPDYHLLSMSDYVSMNLQVTRGCPFNCDFCEITTLLGHKVRMKKTEQIIEELNTLYQLNWHGAVSIVDDNFIGNKKEVKNNLLPAMYNWMNTHDHPFLFNIQSTINLADDEDLMLLMTQTGFNSAFIGIETPDEVALHDCNKVQNKNRDMVSCVRKIQKAGLQVSAGFIVGFDSDSPSVFQRQIDFIQKSGIVSAMVGLLNAPKNTQLYQRLKGENRLTVDPTGSNTDMTMNFTPKMNYPELIVGYKKIIHGIYSAKPYYQRLRQFMLNYKPKPKKHKKLEFRYIKAFVKSLFIIGIIKNGQFEYWKFLVWTLIRRPRFFKDAVTFSVYGYHFRATYGI